jgi:outer membrane biosynthesis protein TonB
MAEKKSQKQEEELEATQSVEATEEKTEAPKEEEKPKTTKAKAPKKKPLKPYVHIDTFLQTAMPFFGLSSVQAQGFKSRMNGKHYQRDEQVFVTELRKYLNLK